MLKIITILTISILLGSAGINSFAQSDDRLAILQTSQGKIVIEFFPDDAPNHVKNFIELTKNGFYDNTVFHRIIPGFMIQGGDPKTKPDSGADQSEWGTGGPDTLLDAEFNTIKHNRGIVSMARSADPNSAGSQFFIVHKDSNFLDEQYTVFGRIITDESFETLDKIASIPTTTNDRPVNPEKVRITSAEIISRSEIPDILDLNEPERTESPEAQFQESQLYENEDLGIKFSLPAGWILQEPPKTEDNTPDVVAVGPKGGTTPPIISLTVQEHDGESIDDYIKQQEELLQPSIDTGSLIILSQEKKSINGNDAFETNAQGFFKNPEGTDIDVQFRQIAVRIPDKFYILSYSNDKNFFESQLPNFVDSINSIEILDEDQKGIQEIVEDNSLEQVGGGGCLIATATFGSELAPQVQELRELRDNTILQTESGTEFIKGFNVMYYSFSPTIADLERQNPLFKEVVRLAITPMISSLSVLTYADINSESEMIGYGITVILMNLGMYFAAPAIIIHKIRK